MYALSNRCTCRSLINLQYNLLLLLLFIFFLLSYSHSYSYSYRYRYSYRGIRSVQTFPFPSHGREAIPVSFLRTEKFSCPFFIGNEGFFLSCLYILWWKYGAVWQRKNAVAQNAHPAQLCFPYGLHNWSTADHYYAARWCNIQLSSPTTTEAPSPVWIYLPHSSTSCMNKLHLCNVLQL